MHAKDLTSIANASAARLNEFKAFCGLRTVGLKGTYWVRKSATSPATRKEYFFKKSMKTPDLRTAVMRALPEVEAFLTRITNPSGPGTASSGKIATLGEVFAAYRAGPTIKANKATRERNICDLTRLINLVHGADFAVEQASCEIIGKPLAKGYLTARLAAATAEHGTNLAAIEASKRAMNSTLTHARSLFSREAMEDYSTLTLPACVREFAEALPVKARKADEPEQLPADLVARLMAAAEKLREYDVTTWAVFVLMLWGGLRNKECMHARKDWLTKIAGGYRLAMKAAGDFLPKGRSRAVIIPQSIGDALLGMTQIEVEWYGSMRVAMIGADDHLVPALSKSHRSMACRVRLNLWLRDQGVTGDAGKIAYRLRKYFLTMVAQQQGLAFAQNAAGHASMTTTVENYVGTPKMTKPITFPSASLAAG